MSLPTLPASPEVRATPLAGLVCAAGIRNGPKTLGSLNRPWARDAFSPASTSWPGKATNRASTAATLDITAPATYALTTSRVRAAVRR